ncbi:phosphate/phosphite/phosphonate ABC transporter substrate-binding protein [Salaquimonas pukyongi]|uniref:phosphate/phosphite/phosphonate ABC transporter substrate-binding protein n=1 Tax=Salaquimonas pukyongi TaxID=2712698 RepID=UPI00096B6E44|nr:PhnD/SsuA/transferrin family substrate-binding protein [Salaquimonas pukyongi]
MIAALPMYDWPEIRHHTERFWQVLRQMLADHGIGGAVPQNLSRAGDPHALWLDPGLLIGQTCGLPFVNELEGKVTLLGSPTYAIGCGPGNYRSVLIAGEGREDIDPFKTPSLRFAYNDPRSQSGLAAWLSGVLQAGGKLPKGLVPVRTGSHRASIQAVAEDSADLAAIDAVTFELARRLDPAARRVSVIGHTPETPGLPFIASATFSGRKDQLCCAIEDAIAELDEETSQALLITCFKRRGEEDYRPIAESWQAVKAAGLDKLFVA